MMMKGLSYTSFILAKFVVLSVATAAILLISAAISHVYTFILFSEAVSTWRMIQGVLFFIPSALLVVAMQIFFSTVAKSVAISAVYGFLSLLLLGLIGSMPCIGPLSPGSLMFDWPMGLTMGERHSDMWIALGITLALTALLLTLSVNILRKSEE